MKKIERLMEEGVLFHQQGALDEAEKRYFKVLRQNPKNADALHLRGMLAYQRNKPEEGLPLVKQAIEAKPNEPLFWKTYGLIQRRLGDITQAIAAYENSLKLSPRDAETWLNLGTAYQYLDDLPQAVGSYRRALELRPNYPLVLQNLALALRDNGFYAEALEIWEYAPQGSLPEWMRLNLLQHICEWREFQNHCGELIEIALDESGECVAPFALLSIPSSANEQKECAIRWADRNMPVITHVLSPSPDLEPGRAIRIGYLSWDFQEHATAYLIAEVFELHDRQRFEIYLYSYGPIDDSPMRRRLQEMGNFFDIRDESYEDAARLIHSHGIDILVDLKGHTAHTRSKILSYQPAPVQINWLGYPGTMGATCVNYLIADSFVIPEGAEDDYCESILRMPNCYQPNDRRRTSAPPLSRQEYGLPENVLVFACFTQSVKILPGMFSIWVEALSTAPRSVLWLLDVGGAAKANLIREAESRGVTGDRLIFAQKIPLAQHLARYTVVDLALETFPYTSHTTASDALWMGCPLVTCAGTTFASRVAGSILHAAGFPDLVTDSLEEYRKKILELVRDPEQLVDLRRRIEGVRDSCALFDTPSFVRDLENLYRSIVKPI